MAEETWTVKGVSITGDVVHEGYLEKAGEAFLGLFGGGFEKRWCKLIVCKPIGMEPRKIWLVYFHLDKKGYEDMKSDDVLWNVANGADLARYLTHPGVIPLHKMKCLKHKVDTGQNKKKPGFDIHPIKADDRIWHICFCDGDGETFVDPLGWVSHIRAWALNINADIVTYPVKDTNKIKKEPTLAIPVEKRKISDMTVARLTVLGDRYLVTRTLGMGSSGKFRIAMRLAGSEELLGVKVVRLIPDTFPTSEDFPGEPDDVGGKVGDKKTYSVRAQEALGEPKLMVNLGCRVKVYETITVDAVGADKKYQPSKPQKAYLIMAAHYDFNECLAKIQDKDLQLIGRYLLCEVAADLERCHKHKPPYVHCDLKPGNIFVDKDGIIMLADYGGALPAETDDVQIQCSPGFFPSDDWKDGYIEAAGPVKTGVGTDVFALAISWMVLLARNLVVSPGDIKATMLAKKVNSFASGGNAGAAWSHEAKKAGPEFNEIATTDKKVLEILWPRVLRQPT
ncbi:MAG: hypothetical protein WCI05_10760, partial [Myxococcales bacterium]